MTIAEDRPMPRPRTLSLLASVVTGAACLTALCARADAQEVQVVPQQPQMAPQQMQPQMQQPQMQQMQPQQMQPQLAPLPPQQAPTIIIQQQPYAPPVYQGQPPVYQTAPQPYYQPQPQPQPAPVGPRIIKNWEDGPIPAGYHEETHARAGLVIAGACLFGTFYLFTAMGAAISNDAGNPANSLYVPVFGPFIQAAQSSSSTGAFFLAFDGIVQAGGVTMFALGFALPKKQLVRNDFGIEWSVKPLVARDQQGLGLVGRF
jgi:hypothetical protein